MLLTLVNKVLVVPVAYLQGEVLCHYTSGTNIRRDLSTQTLYAGKHSSHCAKYQRQPLQAHPSIVTRRADVMFLSHPQTQITHSLHKQLHATLTPLNLSQCSSVNCELLHFRALALTSAQDEYVSYNIYSYTTEFSNLIGRKV